MAKDAGELLSEALQLPAEGRAALADSLIDSLDSEVDEDAEEAWRIEIDRRIQELDRGIVRAVASDDARRQIRAALRRGQDSFETRQSTRLKSRVSRSSP